MCNTEDASLPCWACCKKQNGSRWKRNTSFFIKTFHLVLKISGEKIQLILVRFGPSLKRLLHVKNRWGVSALVQAFHNFLSVMPPRLKMMWKVGYEPPIAFSLQRYLTLRDFLGRWCVRWCVWCTTGVTECHFCINRVLQLINYHSIWFLVTGEMWRSHRGGRGKKGCGHPGSQSRGMFVVWRLCPSVGPFVGP